MTTENNNIKVANNKPRTLHYRTVWNNVNIPHLYMYKQEIYAGVQ